MHTPYDEAHGMSPRGSRVRADASGKSKIEVVTSAGCMHPDNCDIQMPERTRAYAPPRIFTLGLCVLRRTV